MLAQKTHLALTKLNLYASQLWTLCLPNAFSIAKTLKYINTSALLHPRSDYKNCCRVLIAETEITPKLRRVYACMLPPFGVWGGHDLRSGEHDGIQWGGSQSLPTDTGVKIEKKEILALTSRFCHSFSLEFKSEGQKIGLRCKI